MSDMNRRDFLATAAAATCAACAFPCGGLAFAADAPPVGPVDVGALADFAKDGPVDKFAKSHNLLVIRDKGRLIAPSATCTHKKAILKIEDGKLICPKHDSPFDNEGVPLPKTADGEDTPAKKPLPRYAIAVDDKGRVIVDTSKTFEKDKWEDPAAFVEAEKK